VGLETPVFCGDSSGFPGFIGSCKVTAVELPGLRRVAYRVVLTQAAITILAAAICLVWGPLAALSAAIGGGIGTAASLVLALIAFRPGEQDPARIARAFYVGEAAKLGVVVLLFVLVLNTVKVIPAALFGAYVATFLAYWVALARA
jgi:ATP synthase protein I